MESKVNSVIYFDTVEVVHKSSVPWVWARRVSEIGIGDWIYGFIGDGVRGMCRVGGAGVEEFAVGAVPRGAATVAGPRLQRPEQAQAQGTHQDEASPPSFSMAPRTEGYAAYIPLPCATTSQAPLIKSNVIHICL